MQEDEDIGLDNSKHGGSAYTHEVQMTAAADVHLVNHGEATTKPLA